MGLGDHLPDLRPARGDHLPDLWETALNALATFGLAKDYGATKALRGIDLEVPCWVCFVIAVVALATSILRSVVGAIGATIALLLLLGLLEGLPSAATWFPTSLSQSTAGLIDRPAGGIWHGVVIAGVVIVVALAVTLHRLSQRELSK